MGQGGKFCGIGEEEARVEHQDNQRLYNSVYMPELILPGEYLMSEDYKYENSGSYGKSSHAHHLCAFQIV